MTPEYTRLSELIIYDFVYEGNHFFYSKDLVQNILIDLLSKNINKTNLIFSQVVAIRSIMIGSNDKHLSNVLNTYRIIETISIDQFRFLINNIPILDPSKETPDSHEWTCLMRERFKDLTKK